MTDKMYETVLATLIVVALLAVFIKSNRLSSVLVWQVVGMTMPSVDNADRSHVFKVGVGRRRNVSVIGAGGVDRRVSMTH